MRMPTFLNIRPSRTNEGSHEPENASIVSRVEIPIHLLIGFQPEIFADNFEGESFLITEFRRNHRVAQRGREQPLIILGNRAVHVNSVAACCVPPERWASNPSVFLLLSRPGCLSMPRYAREALPVLFTRNKFDAVVRPR